MISLTLATPAGSWSVAAEEETKASNLLAIYAESLGVTAEAGEEARADVVLHALIQHMVERARQHMIQAEYMRAQETARSMVGYLKEGKSDVKGN